MRVVALELFRNRISRFVSDLFKLSSSKVVNKMNIEDYRKECPTCLEVMIDYVLERSRDCHILDLGSGYAGTFASFQHANAYTHFMAVDVIFAGRFIPGESPAAITSWRKPHVNIECIGMDIKEFYQSSSHKYLSHFDIVIMSEVFSAPVDFLAISSMLKPDWGIFLCGKYTRPGITACRPESSQFSSRARSLIEPCEAFCVAEYARQGCFSIAWQCGERHWAFQRRGAFEKDNILIFPFVYEGISENRSESDQNTNPNPDSTAVPESSSCLLL